MLDYMLFCDCLITVSFRQRGTVVFDALWRIFFRMSGAMELLWLECPMHITRGLCVVLEITGLF